jgi:hypothetical protein
MREKYRLAGPNERASEGIRGTVEVVGGVDGTIDLLAGAIERPLARVEPSDVLVQLVLVVEMLGKTEPVAEGAINNAPGPPIARLEVVTV